MCLVSYIPSENGYLLTSNRDEDKVRAKACLLPEEYEFDSNVLLFPKDPKGGTWIASKNNCECLVLLNGAFEKHEREDFYRKSRGLIFLEFFSATNLISTWNTYDLQQIEPFTLCYITSESDIFELVWDGKKKHTTTLDKNTSHFWMSCTLYSRDEYKRIKEHFVNFIHHNSCYNDILDFHVKHQYQGIKNNLGIKTIDTVSLTQISKEAEHMSMHYVSF